MLPAMSISVDELRDFLRRDPPRPVPGPIRKKALRGALPHAVPLFGLFFGLFGSLFVAIFFPWRIVDDILLNAAGRTTTEATVTARTETNMKENERRVHRYEFTYTPEDGVPRTGVCYETGGSSDAGSRVPVQYLSSDPSVARIKGCRLSKFGWGGGFVIIFPLVGFGIAFFSIRSRARLASLLSRGRFSSGRIESVESTNVSVNNQRRYRVTVSFKDDFADRTTSYYAYGDQVALAEEKREKQSSVGILYDPANPDRVFLVDQLLSP